MSHVSPLEYTAIGAFAGITEVFIMQPTVSIKNALQEGRPVPRNISGLYRGLAVNAAGQFPITACQFGAARVLSQMYERVVGHEPDLAGKMAISLGAGGASALLSCPAEFLVIQQQKTGQPLEIAAARVFKTYGPLKLYKGLSSTMVRGSVYTASYMAVLPVLKQYLAEHTALGSVQGAPLLVAGILAGGLGTVATHPADTFKTRMQAFPDSEQYPQYRSMVSTGRHMLRTEGAAALFRGLLPRVLRNCGAVIILNRCMTEMVDAVDDHRIRQARSAAAAEKAAEKAKVREATEAAAPLARGSAPVPAPAVMPNVGMGLGVGPLTAACEGRPMAAAPQPKQ